MLRMIATNGIHGRARAFALAATGGLVVLVLAGSIVLSSGEEARATVNACPQSRVFYTPHPDARRFALPRKIPWVTTRPLPNKGAGFLFYYSAGMFRSRPEQAIIATNGKISASQGTKIFWWMPGGGPRLIVIGQQLDGSGSFKQEFPALAPGSVSYSSIINVPSPGCWQLSLRTGDVSRTLVFRAVPSTA